MTALSAIVLIAELYTGSFDMIGFDIVVGDGADVLRSCSVALGAGITIRGDHILRIAGEPDKAVYSLSPELVLRINEEIANMANTSYRIGPDYVKLWNDACGRAPSS